MHAMCTRCTLWGRSAENSYTGPCCARLGHQSQPASRDTERRRSGLFHFQRMNLRGYASRAVAHCVALLPLFVRSHGLTCRLICLQHTFVLGLAVFCRRPHRVHIAFTRVGRTENRVHQSAEYGVYPDVM